MCRCMRTSVLFYDKQLISNKADVGFYNLNISTKEEEYFGT
jgi:hypothetical protein